ncbi:hypothetical protein J3R03_002456 [Actinoplanes couchii]|nr:hypothetical protein [Actinoplanes couchii]
MVPDPGAPDQITGALIMGVGVVSKAANGGR